MKLLIPLIYNSNFRFKQNSYLSLSVQISFSKLTRAAVIKVHIKEKNRVNKRNKFGIYIWRTNSIPGKPEIEAKSTHSTKCKISTSSVAMHLHAINPANYKPTIESDPNSESRYRGRISISISVSKKKQAFYKKIRRNSLKSKQRI